MLTISKAMIVTATSQTTDQKNESTGEESMYTTAAINAAAAGIGIPTKYLRSGLPGFFGVGFV